jgi:hypothetical protein
MTNEGGRNQADRTTTVLWWFASFTASFLGAAIAIPTTGLLIRCLASDDIAPGVATVILAAGTLLGAAAARWWGAPRTRTFMDGLLFPQRRRDGRS